MFNFVMFIVGIPIALYNALIFTYMWSWFFVPFGLPSITLIPAYGMILVCDFLFANRNMDYILDTKDRSVKEKNERTLIKTVATVLISTFIWGIAYIVHLFV